MRKKSHLALTNFILDYANSKEIIAKKRTLHFGGLVPDLIPSFLTKKHRIDLTFDILEKKIHNLIQHFDCDKGLTFFNTRDLGEITHYLADYFTFPHNVQFEGGLKEHFIYEKEMIETFKVYLKNSETATRLEMRTFKEDLYCLDTAGDICNYIKKFHRDYIVKKHTVLSDCEHIVLICTLVVQAILRIISEKEYLFIRNQRIVGALS